MSQRQQFNENIEYGDLKRLIHPQLHIDQYKSKMGNDDEVCVLSFLVRDKEPSNDLVSFIEKGYPWVLDADVSSGEKEDGKYLVFVETERRLDLPEQIVHMIEDILNLTEQTIEEWTVKYHQDTQQHPLTAENLERLIPLSPKEYRDKVEDVTKGDEELDALKTAAGVPVDTVAPTNQFTESIRVLAGLK